MRWEAEVSCHLSAMGISSRDLPVAELWSCTQFRLLVDLDAEDSRNVFS